MRFSIATVVRYAASLLSIATVSQHATFLLISTVVRFIISLLTVTTVQYATFLPIATAVHCAASLLIIATVVRRCCSAAFTATTVSVVPDLLVAHVPYKDPNHHNSTSLFFFTPRSTPIPPLSLREKPRFSRYPSGHAISIVSMGSLSSTT